MGTPDALEIWWPPQWEYRAEDDAIADVWLRKAILRGHPTVNSVGQYRNWGQQYAFMDNNPITNNKAYFVETELELRCILLELAKLSLPRR